MVVSFSQCTPGGDRVPVEDEEPSQEWRLKAVDGAIPPGLDL
jgi:hypothetical protein